MRVLAWAVGLAVVASPALATETAATSSSKEADQERIICKQRQKANSRFTTRVCLTKAEWEFRTEQHRKGFDEIQNRPYISTVRGN